MFFLSRGPTSSSCWRLLWALVVSHHMPTYTWGDGSIICLPPKNTTIYYPTCYVGIDISTMFSCCGREHLMNLINLCVWFMITSIISNSLWNIVLPALHSLTWILTLIMMALLTRLYFLSPQWETQYFMHQVHIPAHWFKVFHTASICGWRKTAWMIRCFNKKRISSAGEYYRGAIAIGATRGAIARPALKRPLERPNWDQGMQFCTTDQR